MKPPFQWIVARLGQDMNWWVDEASDDLYWGSDLISVLDPRQVAYLREALAQYESYGLDPGSLSRAFHVFEVASELSDGRLRLAPSSHSILEEGVSAFALPDLIRDEEGAYADFLDRVAAMRIRLLNSTHRYFQDLDVLDMEEDIRARNTDRYFGGCAVHVFNELEDILTWKPAEWDDDEEAKPELEPEDEPTELEDADEL